MLDPGPSFARRLLNWYDRAQRPLPWRTTGISGNRPDAYPVLVSEAMLQQTQVAAVVPYFHRFMARFPTLQSLAQADQQEVLRLWQGLGYYSRARNLHQAAVTVVRDFGGQIPATAGELLALPGVGRYTAGAVASIAFGQRTPILDGNVQRVLCRLDCVRTDPRDRQTNAMLWRRAEEILPKSRVGDFNSALMELGATICTPKSPQCLLCPVQRHCQAFAEGLQERVPLPKPAKPTPLFVRRTYCIRHGDQWLIEQRPPEGRWAGMWQFLTLTGSNQGAFAATRFGLPLKTTTPKPFTVIEHALTHRRYRFEVFTCEALASNGQSEGTSQRWVTLEGLDAFPLPRPHVKIAAMLRDIA